MIVLDVTIVGVALPSIKDDLGFSRHVARVGGERVPAHVRRLPVARRPARRPLRPSATFPDRNLACSRSLRSLAASRPRRDCSSSRAASRGVGGAVASAVSLSLMVNLFTEPGERAKAMGIFGFVASAAGASASCSAGSSPTSSAGTGSSSSTSRSASFVVLLSLRLLPEDRACRRRASASTSRAR